MTAAFTTKKVKSQTLGEFLRTCREKSELSLADIAKLSQVQPKFLLALEDGRYQDLPDPVYVQGFLKSLARIYHAAPDKLLEQYFGEREVARNIESVKTVAQKNYFVTPKFIFSSKTLVLAGLTLLGLATVSYLYFQFSSLKRPPQLTILSPQENETVNSAELSVKGKTEPGSTVFLNNQPIVVDAQGEFQENLSLAPGSNFLTIKATNKFGQSTALTRSFVYQEKEIAGIATGTVPVIGGEQGLNLEIMMGGEAAWIEVSADGEQKYAGTMLPNAKQVIVAQERIVLTTGNAGTTRVKLNGKDLGALGKEGEVIKDLEFTQ